jgi:hypothetical protein
VIAAPDIAPVVHVDAARIQHVLTRRALDVAVESTEDAKVRITARIEVAGSNRHFRTIGYLRQLQDGQKRTFHLILTKGTRAALSQPLRDGRRVTAQVRVSVRDAAQNATVKRITIRCLR